MKTKFIINPKAGTGKQNEIENSILKIIDKKKFHYDLEYTNAPNHATEISNNAINDNYDLIVAVGGDGTASECAKALIGSNKARTLFGTLIPLASYLFPKHLDLHQIMI